MSATRASSEMVMPGYSRVRKLFTMSTRELAVRASYELLAAWERARNQQRGEDLSARLERAVAPGALSRASRLEGLLARGREPRAAFLVGRQNRAELQALFTTEYRSELEASRRAAEAVRAHRFKFFGQLFVYGPEIDWHADPQTGRVWPYVYHRDVPIHDDRGAGDVKYVWELNRQQFLIDLGKICFVDSRPADAAAASALVKSWIAANPPGIGVNWACALEPAFRVLSWLWTYHLCLESATGLDDDSHVIWLSGFHEHGTFLSRHLEYYSSPYNHLIGEASALYALGVLFPEFRAARAWRRRGRRVLESRLRAQFYTDGGSVEQSTFYHHATLGFYLFAALVGRANGEEFSDSVWRAIERAIEFSMYMTQPDGCTPPIGGADDGKPIRLEHRPQWDFRAFQAAGAVLFNRGDMKYVAGGFPEDAVWLLGPSGRKSFDAIPSVLPQHTACAFDASGYFVARSAWTKDASYLCFDCGEQADGVRRDGVPNAVHGHADCLSATVWLGGRPVLVDAGVYRYNGDPAWVGHFRRTAAHNTISIDRRDQARYHGKMAWSNAFLPRLELWRAEPDEVVAMGSHDGYAREVGGVVHRRIAWLRPDAYVIFMDELVGEGSHAVELRWQFAPGDAALVGTHAMRFDDFAESAWAASVETSADLRAGGSRPDDGWIATGLGVRRAAPVLTIAAQFHAPQATFLTVHADKNATRGMPRTAVMRNGNRGIAIAVRNRDSIDWVVAGDMQQMLPFRTAAKLAVWTISEGRVREVRLVGAGSFQPIEGSEIDVPNIFETSPLATEAALGRGR